jgi:inorganic pyrophosphatase
VTKKLSQLPAWGDEGELRVIVESPRGSGVKFKFEPQLGCFTVARAFPLGTTYPFDWGFIPGTRDEDGDPLDALVLHDAATYPGIILPCQVLGMVVIDQKDKSKKTVCNNRIIAIPTWHDRLGEFETTGELPRRIRAEIEQFFVNAVFFTHKKLALKGWKDSRDAIKFIKQCEKS